MRVTETYDLRGNEYNQLRDIDIAVLVGRRLKTRQLAEPWNPTDRGALLLVEIAHHEGTLALQQRHRAGELLAVENWVAVECLTGQ